MQTKDDPGEGSLRGAIVRVKWEEVQKSRQELEMRKARRLCQDPPSGDPADTPTVQIYIKTTIACHSREIVLHHGESILVLYRKQLLEWLRISFESQLRLCTHMESTSHTIDTAQADLANPTQDGKRSFRSSSVKRRKPGAKEQTRREIQMPGMRT